MNRAVWLISAVLLLSMAGVAAAADTNTLTVNANVVGTCKFDSGTSTLAFNPLDPNDTADGTGSVIISFWCTRGAAVKAITDDDGLYDTGPGAKRMRHDTDTNEFLKYTLAYSAASATGGGPNAPINLTINGTIANADYTGALAGNYSDQVIISFAP